MEKLGFEEERTLALLPLPPPPPRRSVMCRTGTGKNGRRINLIANHFKVAVTVPDAVFFQYSVSIKSASEGGETDRAAAVVLEGKGIGRKVMEKLHKTYSSELAGKQFAYDGEKALYTVGALPHNKFDFIVVLEDAAIKRNGSPEICSDANRKRSKRTFQSKTFIVEISFAAKISMRPIALALKGLEADNTGDALRVIDIILRQQAAQRGLGQSFFNDDVRNFVNVGRGFHSRSGLSLNMGIYVSSTMILTPVPLLDFILTNETLWDMEAVDHKLMEGMLMEGLCCMHPDSRPTMKEADRMLRGEAPFPILPYRKPEIVYPPPLGAEEMLPSSPLSQGAEEIMQRDRNLIYCGSPWSTLLFFFVFFFTCLSPCLSLSFSLQNNFTLYGDAKFTRDAISLIQESPPQINEFNDYYSFYSSVGRALSTYPIRFLDPSNGYTGSFSCRFSFTITPTSYNFGGDGLTFLITSNATSDSTTLGYLGLPADTKGTKESFLAVEFDTKFDPNLGDINDNHMSINVNTIFPVASADLMEINLKSGKEITVWIEYVDDKMMSVWAAYSKDKPLHPILSIHIDLEEVLKGDRYVGLSASNGHGYLGSASILVQSWQFRLNLQGWKEIREILRFIYKQWIILCITFVAILFTAWMANLFELDMDRVEF